MQTSKLLVCLLRRSLHAAGVRRSHTTVPVQSCKTCGFQSASINCLRCARSYCDTCYVNKHTLRRGDPGDDTHGARGGKYTIKVRWRDHKTTRILQACDQCETRTAKLWCRR